MSYWLFVTGYWCIFNQKLMGFLRAALQTTALYLRTSLRLGAFARDTGSGILPFPRVAPLIMSFFFAYILAPWRLCARHLYRLQKSVVAILFTYLWTSRKTFNDCIQACDMSRLINNINGEPGSKGFPVGFSSILRP